MAAQFSQAVGELIGYQQDVKNDTISSAVWSVVPDEGTTLTGGSTGPTSVSKLFGAQTPASYVLSVEMQMASGQVLIGEARIQVVAVKV